MSTEGRGPIGPEGYSERTALTGLDELAGMEVRDAEGDRIGKVDDSYVDAGAGHVRYIAVTTGWLGRKRHVIPVDDLAIERDADGDDYLSVPYARERLESAPSYEPDEELSHEHERRVYGHYGRPGYWEDVRARQTAPAPTPEIAEAEAEDLIRRGDDPSKVRVKRWGI